MNPRRTWIWVLTAAILLGAILISRNLSRPTIHGPQGILSSLKPSEVVSVQVRATGQMELRADLTNGAWCLSAPIAYPAQGPKIEALIQALSKLVPATTISGEELRARPKSGEEYGLTHPQAYIILQQTGFVAHIQVGALTTPGDQVFVQVVGTENAYVVDADLLKHIPRTLNAWRETTLLAPQDLACDRISVTNKGKVFELHHSPERWSLTLPIPARADNPKIEEALQKLARVEVRDFVTDDPAADLESLGLQPPQLSISLNRGTNRTALLLIGNSPTNDPALVFARRSGSRTIVTIPRDPLDPWSQPGSSYRDPLLIGPLPELDLIKVTGPDPFTLERGTNDSWNVMPQNVPADAWMVKNLIGTLAGLTVVEYVREVVTPPDLPAYGLSQPRWQYALRGQGKTNDLLQVSFGTNSADRVFASRSDENTVYAVPQGAVTHLPAGGWAMRERKFWNLDVEQVKSLTLMVGGRSNQLLRQGAHQWALAPGSQGVINELAVEETVRGLCQASAVVWVGVGDHRAQYGFKENGHQLTLELKDGTKYTVEFGADAPSGSAYAAVSLGKQPWFLEFPWPLFRDIQSYLPAPRGGP